jgi:septum formation protein
MIYLASTSPRRKTLLKKAGITFRILKPTYEEDYDLKGPPSKIVQVHAVKKAESCRGEVKDGTLLAADTLVYVEGEIVGKPKDMKKARLMLGRLQGRWHSVYTGVALFKMASGRVVKKTIFFEKTQVRLKGLTPKGVENYFKKVNPLDKAGAYAIQSRRGGIVQEVRGLVSNAVGLPIEKILKKLF